MCKKTWKQIMKECQNLGGGCSNKACYCSNYTKDGQLKCKTVQSFNKEMNRDTFMKYWRMENWIEENLTADDRMEIFMDAPTGQADLTYHNITKLFNNYNGSNNVKIMLDIGQFNITSVHRDDLRNSYPEIPNNIIDTISNDIMSKLACKMENDYCNQLFTQSLKVLVDDYMEDTVFSERSTCTNCGKDSSREGFVNRIEHCGSYSQKKEDGAKFPEGGYICGICSTEMDDDVDCDHCEITISRESSHDVGKETVCGNCYVKIETNEQGGPVG